jgi:hypothetical protein
MNWIPRNSLYNLWHLRYEIANPPIFVEFVLLFIKSSTKFFLDHCLYFFNWQLHCLFFFDIRLLISALASSLFCYVLSVNVTCYVLSVNVTCYVLSVNAIYSVLFVKCELFCPVCKCSLLCSVCKCNLFCYVNINVDQYFVDRCCHFVAFLLAIVLSVLLWFTASDYPLVIPLISLSCSCYVLFVKLSLLCFVCKM